MALKLGELVAILKTDNSGLDKGLADGHRKVRATGAAMEADARASGARAGRGFGDGGRRGGEDFADGIGTGVRTASGMMSNLASTVGAVAGPLAGTAGALLAIGSAAAFAAPLVGALGGALGSLPGLMAGLGAVTGVLGLGFMGLGDHFKKAAGGSAGGAMVDRAYQILQAERRLRDANEEVTESQKNLTRAREDAAEATAALAKAEEDAKEKLEDLARSVKGAHIDQEKATLRAKQALEKYQQVLKYPGDPQAIEEARLAYEDAQQAADEAKDKAEDLDKENAEAQKKGIKGSDEVKEATKRQEAAIDAVEAARKRERAAIEGVQDAEHALEQARKKSAAGGGGAAQQLTKLSPAAAAAVAAIKSLKPAFESLRLDVQEKLFKGVGDRIKEAANAWLPTLHTRLGQIATTINGLFHQFATSITRVGFIEDISTAMDTADKAIARVGGAVTGPLVDAFGRLARAAGPFIGQLGEEIASIVEDFSEWIKRADDSGALENFFESAAKSLHQIFTIGRTVVTIIGQIMGAIFASGEKKDPLASFQDALNRVSAWLANPDNQKKISDFFTTLTAWIGKVVFFLEKIGPIASAVFTALTVSAQMGANAMQWFGTVLSTVHGWFARIGRNAPKWWDAVKHAAGKAKDWIVDKWNALIGWFRKLPRSISRAASGMWDGIKENFRKMINWIIGRWNNLSFTIGGGSFAGMAVPSATFSTPDIPYLAQGGIVPATRGGRLAVVGEGGSDEAVIPLSRLKEMMGRQVLEIRGDGSAVSDFILEMMRLSVKAKGGNVQVVVGQGA